jgi:cyclopropane-fatty-acyl-phospholipid synthase
MALLSPARGDAMPQPARGVWPGLFEVPRSGVHAAVARRVLQGAARNLPLTVAFPDGTSWGTGGPRLQVVRPEAFFARLGRDGLIGFGEAWMTGDITTGGWAAPADGDLPARPSAAQINAATDELASVLTVLATRLTMLVPAPLQKLRKYWQHRPPASEDNTPTNARKNIHRHYDLSNDLFETFLDPTMTYSSAWFEPGDDLQTAQLRKIDGVLDLARVEPGMRVLEIGSGWGALALRAAAERDVTVTTLTLSQEQQALAEDRIRAAGLADRIEVRLEDYRAHAATHPGAYDAVVSVEMIEAVGERYWPDYFRAVARVLTGTGRFGLQAITIGHDRMIETRNSYSWVHKYVFPGGALPSLRAIEGTLVAHTDRRILETRRLGRSYATTLELWRHRFNEQLPHIRELGFDETFIRMWNFYLAYSQAGFAADYLDDWQLGIGRV